MIEAIRKLWNDSSVSSVVAGFLAVLISYAGPLVIVFEAARLSNYSTELTTSWIWAISIGSGVTGILLSWKLKVPIITAWSTPGAALLVVTLPGIPVGEAVGAYIASALVTTALGLSGVFDRLIERIPKGIAAAMLAGILLRFGTDVFASISSSPVLVLLMVLTFLLVKRLRPRYAVASVMFVGIALAAFSGETNLAAVTLAAVHPVFVTPEWSWQTVLSLGVPLALVTLTGQYVPGMAVLRTSGYEVQASSTVSITGLASALLAPFGSHAVNLAAITAAICTGKDAHDDPEKRYVAGIACGVFYILIGTFGGALALLFSSLPHELIPAYLTGVSTTAGSSVEKRSRGPAQPVKASVAATRSQRFPFGHADKTGVLRRCSKSG
jgi:benzoate membrane transport protein